ncbi:MAG: hypothetical protein VYE77_02540 [Planctomycetota bacterium]|nr:hypothetical protein [Planctomycetota bacterium]MEE2886574.1 hypothetical protein [Planctomycetota bacterium]
MRISRFLVVVAVSLLAAGAAASGEKPGHGECAAQKQNGGTNGDQKDGDQQSELDKLLAQCRADLATVGPNSRQKRAVAVATLLSVDDQRAHSILQEYVIPGDDPQGIRHLVLLELARQLANLNAAAFYRSKQRDVIRRTYLVKLVQHFDGKPAANPKLAALRSLARAALAAMRTKEDLQTGLGDLLKIEELSLNAVYAIGQAQEPALAPLLGDLLDGTGKDKLKAQAASAALENLCYETFFDKQSFDAWWAKNKDKGYIELAERYARRARQILRDEVGAARQRHTETVVQLVELLARSTMKDRWKKIGREVFESGAPELTSASLGRLAEVLADVVPDSKASEAKDRLAFAAEIGRRLAAQPADAQHALLLEVGSYLCAPDETAPRKAQQALLQKGVSHPSTLVRLAALRGLRRFFTPANRSLVVDVAAEAQSADDLEQLQVVIGTLKTEDWSAPRAAEEADLARWIGVLRNLLTDKALPTALRIDALKVLCRSDADGARLRPVFNILLAEVIREDLIVEVRSQVLVRLQRLLPAKVGAARDAATAEYLQLLSGLQESEVPEIRLAAVRLLVLPDNLAPEHREKLGRSLIQSVGQRLLTETDDAVFAAQVAALRNFGGEDVHVAAVNASLREALDALRAKPAAAKRLSVLVGGLKQLALNERSTAAEWFKTCLLLLEPPLADRPSIRSILQYHVGRDNGQKLATETKELQVSIHKLVIRTAALRSDAAPWSSDKNQDEAKMVQAACKALSADKELPIDRAFDTATMRMTSLRCLVAMKDSAYLAQILEAWLADADQVLNGPDRDTARLCYAEALLQQGKPDEAWSKSGIQTVAGTGLPERLRVTDAIVAQLIKDKKGVAAVPLLADLINWTPADSPDYWRRFELGLRLRHQLDPKQSQALLKELDSWVSKQASLTPEQKGIAAKLRAALSDTAKPGK